jgi:hypothetical protein
MEECFVWPHSSDENVVAFTREKIHKIRRIVIKATKDVTLEDKQIVKLSIPVHVTSQDSLTDLKLPVLLTNKSENIPKLLGQYNTDVHDIDGRWKHALDTVSWDRIACVSVCTLRLDDVQHVLFLMKDDVIVHEGWTICEEFITTIRMTQHQLRVRIHRAVFMFDKRTSMLSLVQQERVSRLVMKMFRNAFPEDVISVISKFACESMQSVSISQFNRGLLKGTFNYAIARLLKIGYYKKVKTLPSLTSYEGMSYSERCESYDTLKTVFRNRHRLFDREICHKSTRSGHLY